MALLYAGSSDGPHTPSGSSLQNPFVNHDPLNLNLFNLGTQNSSMDFAHNWGLWNEGAGTDLSLPSTGTRWHTNANAATYNTYRPQTPTWLRDEQCTWGLQNTLIGGIAICDRSHVQANGSTLGEAPVIGFRDKATGDQIIVWLLTDPDPASNVYQNVVHRWRLEVRVGATVLFTSGNILPYAPGSAEAGLDDLPPGFMGNRYMGTTGGVYAAGFLFVEFKAVIHPTTGSFELRVDGVPIAVDAGPINTAEQGTAGGDQLMWSNGGLATTSGAGQRVLIRTDDMYFCDNTTALHNDFLGRVQVHEKTVNGQGTTSAWTPSSGSSNHNTYVGHLGTLVDTTWLESSNPTDDELFTYSDLPRNMKESLLSLRIQLRGRLSTGGDRDISPTYRTGGTTYVEPTFLRVTGPVIATTNFDLVQNPATVAPWTKSDINGQELGFRLIA